jgi:tRNA-2-methylthio-N6-dimethylallyladenosine synthase
VNRAQQVRMSVQSKRRAYVETYGCQMNISDGELMEAVLEADGYEIVSSPEDADVVLVNTCAIREHAERRVLGRVSQLSSIKQTRPDLVIGVTGCMAQRMGNELLEKAPYVDLVMGPDGYRELPSRIRSLDAANAAAPSPLRPTQSWAAHTRAPIKRRVQLAVLDLDSTENYEGLEQRRRAGPSAWVPVQRGCDHRCTFCIVPYVRGPEKNRRPEEVLDEVARLARSGVSEVTLLGQTVNSYRSGDFDFPMLLRAVARIEGIRRVRFTSPHPGDVTDELIEVMATEPAICEQLHLPLQSGSNRTLKRMLRRYTVEQYLDTVDRVRRAIPDVALSTDLIVAFPGESEEELQETLDVVQQVRFDDAFTYRYSPREGTPATRLPAADFLPDLVAQERLERLITVARRVQTEVNESELGRREEVLVEREGRYPGELMGRTRRAKAVAFAGDPSWIGTYRSVHLQSTTGATFAGSVAESELFGEQRSS